jgi:hypothetical protein
MKPEIKDLIFQNALNSLTQGMDISSDGLVEEIILATMHHCSECVRDVYRDESSDLTAKDMNLIQNRMKQFFGVS